MTFSTLWHAFFGREKRLTVIDRRRPQSPIARVNWITAFPERRLVVRRTIDRQNERQRFED